jgi:SNF2 family DNA or RNA helicase
MSKTHISKPNQTIVVPSTELTENLFSSAPSLVTGGRKMLLVPHDLRNTVVLRRHGYEVENPMLSYYPWSGSPFQSQKETCDLLTTEQRAYVLNDMGTGKTKAALWAWDYLKVSGLSKKALVLCPLSTMKFTWQSECFATIPHRSVKILHGTKAERIARLNEPDGEIYIINHDGISTIFDELMASDIDCIIVDELAAFRNESTRTKLLRRLAAKKTWVWGMTGSPMPRSPTDVWSQTKVVNPSLSPKYFSHFRQQVMTNHGVHVWKPKPDAVEQAYAVMQPSIRVKLEDVTELPDCIEKLVSCDLSPQQDKIYKELVKEMTVMVKDKRITAANAGAAMTKLLQVVGGWVYSSEGKGTIAIPCSQRVDAAIDAITSTDRKAILLCPYRHAIDGLAKRLTDADIRFAVVHGDTPHREVIFNQFQRTDKYDVLLAHPQCLSHGLTLTAADTIVWYLPVTDYDVFSQTNARIRRVGQKHKQQIICLTGSPVETHLYKMLRNKQKMQDSFLSLFEGDDT